MRTPAITLLVLFGAAAMVRALDLTPQFVLAEKDSKEQQVSFRDADRKVLFLPPAGWAYSGQANRFQFNPKGSQATQAVIEAVPLKEPKNLDPATLKAFKQQALAAVPAGSEQATLLGEAENALMPGGNPSYQLTMSYKLHGKEFRRCSMLVNCPKEQLLVRFSADKSDYLTLLPVFNRSLMSWQVVEVKPAAPAPVASQPIVEPAAAQSSS